MTSETSESDGVPFALRPPPLAWVSRLYPKSSYVLTRFVLLRLLGFVYFFAFLALARQVLPLVGHDGLLPADDFFDRVAGTLGSRGDAFWRMPGVFWLGISDGALATLSWIGVVLSALVMGGLANGVVLFVLWALYLSFVHVGQLFYGYGWEIQLCETGFLALFLVPVLDPRPFPRRAPPTVVIWLYRWLIIRIMLGAGLIKLRGDPCWRELTCLDYHFETQPIPNPLSPALHFAPEWVHKLGVAFNHLTEVVLPVFLLAPRRLRHLAAAGMLGFQIFLILSGNLSFLNWLTIVPILACFDDGVWRRLMPSAVRERAERAEPPARPARIASWVLAAVVAFLSLNVVSNLFSDRQAMNRSFDPFNLVNTYGAFGSVGSERMEIVFEGTRDEVIVDKSEWRAYEFPCKPGDPERRPCVVAPYQPRLDWQIWFAAMEGPAEAPWTLHLVWKLLHNDRGALSLMANDPFPDGPPRFIRARLYRYHFAPLGAHAWWQRTLVDEWLPPLAADDPGLRQFLDSYGWR